MNLSGLCVTPNKIWIDRGREKISFQSEKLSEGKKKVLSDAKLKLGLGGRTLWLCYYTVRVPFGFSVWMNGTEATGSKGAVLYESRGLEGRRCKMKCINLFCAHVRRSGANSLWKESQFGFTATNYWSAPIIHSNYSYFALTLSCSLPHSSVDLSDLKAFKTCQILYILNK